MEKCPRAGPLSKFTLPAAYSILSSFDHWHAFFPFHPPPPPISFSRPGVRESSSAHVKSTIEAIFGNLDIDFGLHGFRTDFYSRGAELGVSLAYMQAYVGHSAAMGGNNAYSSTTADLVNKVATGLSGESTTHPWKSAVVVDNCPYVRCPDISRSSSTKPAFEYRGGPHYEFQRVVAFALLSLQCATGRPWIMNGTVPNMLIAAYAAAAAEAAFAAGQAAATAGAGAGAGSMAAAPVSSAAGR